MTLLKRIFWRLIVKVEGEVFNVGGGSRISVTDLIKLLEEITGKKARINYIEKQKGMSGIH